MLIPKPRIRSDRVRVIAVGNFSTLLLIICDSLMSEIIDSRSVCEKNIVRTKYKSMIWKLCVKLEMMCDVFLYKRHLAGSLKTREPVRSMVSLILDRYFQVKNRKHFRMSFLTPGIDS